MALVMKALAWRTASTSVSPRASSAVMAAECVQPVPCVCGVSARETGGLNDFQLKLAGTILGYSAGGWLQVPSPRQTRHTVEIIDLWETNRKEEEE